MASMFTSGPPYPLPIWSLGGIPTVNVDIPIMSVYLVLYFMGAIAHGTIFYQNEKKGHKFIFSSLMVGFCVARMLVMILRISGTINTDNVHLAITTSIFLNAGVALLYVDNFLFTLRILRAQHPSFGWRKDVSRVFYFFCALVIVALLILAVAIIQSYYTLDTDVRSICRKLQLFGATVFLICAALPIMVTPIILLVPRTQRLDKFGTGHWASKIATLMTGATLLTIAAAYRTGTLYQDPVPRNQPLPDFLSRPALYVSLFLPEILLVSLYAYMRVDQRFHTPNGATGPGSYRCNAQQDKRTGATSTMSENSTLEQYDTQQKPSRQINIDEQSIGSIDASENVTRVPSRAEMHPDCEAGEHLFSEVEIKRFTGLSMLSGRTYGDEHA